MMAIMFWPGGTPWPMMDVNRWFLIPATIVQFVFGRRFLVAALRGARHGEANMNTLVAIGTLAAYTYSVFVTLMPQAVMPPASGTRRTSTPRPSSSASSCSAAGSRRAPRARRRRGQRPARPGPPTHAFCAGGELEVPVSRSSRATVRVRPGERIPVDGVVDRGRLRRRRDHADRRALPVEKAPGDQVIGATLNTTGSFVFRAERSARTRRSRRSCASSRRRRARRRRSSAWPTASRHFVPAVLGVAALTFVVWFAFGPEPSLPSRCDGDRRPDHRLPVRAGPGHPDGDHGRHRQGGRARAS